MKARHGRDHMVVGFTTTYAMKISTEIDNNFGYEKITQLVDNIPLMQCTRIHKQNIMLYTSP
jgi:dTDP-D-glucose 4,6-dehydratase